MYVYILVFIGVKKILFYFGWLDLGFVFIFEVIEVLVLFGVYGLRERERWFLKENWGDVFRNWEMDVGEEKMIDVYFSM